MPETIEEFRDAGIHVWMLTGDKMETAENIGLSSRMFNEDMTIFRINTVDKETTKNKLELALEIIKNIQNN